MSFVYSAKLTTKLPRMKPQAQDSLDDCHEPRVKYTSNKEAEKEAMSDEESRLAVSPKLEKILPILAHALLPQPAGPTNNRE